MTASTLTLRTALQHDEDALRRLAALDSQRPLTGDVLLAEAGGLAVAAVSVADGRVTADPFRNTADVVNVLGARAAQLRDTERRDEHQRSPRRLALLRTG